MSQGWSCCTPPRPGRAESEQQAAQGSGHGVVLRLQRAWLLWKASQFLWLKVFRQRPLEKVMCSPHICATGSRGPGALITASGCQQLHKAKEGPCCRSLTGEGSSLPLPARRYRQHRHIRFPSLPAREAPEPARRLSSAGTTHRESHALLLSTPWKRHMHTHT